MKRQITIAILTFLISSCCYYDKNDFDFNSDELRHFSNYKIGDTIYFQSNLGDMDTITVVDFKTEQNKNYGGFMAPKPSNGEWVQIKHLPIDNWHGTSQDMTKDGKIEIVYQALFWLSKYPADKKTEYSITFKDFYSSSYSNIGEFHKDTLLLNDLKINNYYIVQHNYPERIKESENIETVYWTDQYGLTGYKNKNGETWTRKSSR